MKYNLSVRLVLALIAFVAGPAASGGEWPENPSPDWTKLVAEAKTEGTLVIAGRTILEGAFIEAFERDTGLEAQFVAAVRSEGRKRFFAEANAAHSVMDVFLSGFSMLALTASGKLLPVTENLILPEVTDPQNWTGGRIPFVDDAQTYLPVPSLYRSGLVLINTNLVDENELNSWQDLLAPKFKGKIVWQDPRTRGGGQTAANYLLKEKGVEYLDALFNGNQVQFVRDYRQMTDLVARGTYPLSVAALSTDIEKYKAQGVDHVKVLRLPDASGYLVGGSAVMGIPANTTHPKAAIVFANWYLSARGQAAFAEALKVPSARLDVDTSSIPDYVKADEYTGLTNTYTEEWVTKTQIPLREMLKTVLEKAN